MKTFSMNDINDMLFFNDLYSFTKKCYDRNSPRSPVLYNYTNGIQEWSWCNNLHAVLISDDTTKHQASIYVDELLMGELQYTISDRRNIVVDNIPLINTDDFYDEILKFINKWDIIPQSSMDLENEFPHKN